MANLNVTLILDDSEYTGKLAGAQAGLERFGKQADQTSQQAQLGFGRITSAAEVLKSKMETLGAALLGAGFLEFTHKTLELADRVSDLSSATDVSIPKLLQLREAFEANGGSADKLNKVVTKLSQNINDAREGSAQAQESLLKLGLSFKDMANLDTEQAMGKVIENLAGMPDKIERNALAFRVFGKEAKAIDWEGVAAGTKGSADEYRKYAAAIDEAGKAHDKLVAASEKLQIAFANVLSASGILDGINDMNDSMSKFEKIALAAGIAMATFAGAAVITSVVKLGEGIVTLTKGMEGLLVALKVLESGTAFGRIASLATMLAVAGAAYFGFDKIQEEMDKRQKERTDEAIAKQKELDAAKASGGNKPAVVPAWQKEITAIDQLSDAYKKANDEILNKINIDRKMLGVSEDEKQMATELTTLTKNYNNQIQDLNNRIAQEAATPQSAARDARIAQLKREKDEVTALYDTYLVKVPEAIRAQQQEAAALRDRAYSRQLDLDVNRQADLMLDQERKSLLTNIEQKYLDIDIAARNSAKARIEAEEKLLGYTAAGEKILINEEKGNKIYEEAIQKATILKDVLRQQVNTSRDFGNNWQVSMKQYIEDSQNGADAAKKIFGDLTKGMEDAFVSFAKTGKLSFKDLANSIIEDLLRIQIRKTLAGLFGGGDTGGGFFKSILGFASGGEVSANKPILVGESGPELFVPHSGGSIVPNNSVGNYGSGGTVVYNISAVDAPSFQALIARDPAFIHSVAQAGSRMYPSMAR